MERENHLYPPSLSLHLSLHSITQPRPATVFRFPHRCGGGYRSWRSPETAPKNVPAIDFLVRCKMGRRHDKNRFGAFWQVARI